MADKFLIAPFDSGLRDDLPSWLIPEKAFTRLNNAYVFRGRVKKRFGSVLIGTNLNDAKYDHLYSRLRIALSGGAGVGTTDGGGDAAGTIPGDTTSWAKLGITFSIDIDGTDTAIYTVKEAGVARDMLQTYATTTATYSTTNGQYSFTGAPADKQIYVYLNLPVMGFFNYESGPVNEHSTFAFDTRAVYKYDGTSWERNGTTTWKGTQTDYFWAENHENPVDASINSFATNYNVTKSGAPAATDDPIYYYDGSTWTNFSTIRKQIKKLNQLEEEQKGGKWDDLIKKERLSLERKLEKLKVNISGLEDLKDLPGALFVTDVNRDSLAVREAKKLGIPIIAICDTNSDPEGISYIIPANDDAIKSLRFLISQIANTIAENKSKRVTLSKKAGEEGTEKTLVKDKNKAKAIKK